MVMLPHAGFTSRPVESALPEGENCSTCEPIPGVLHLYTKDPHTWEIDSAGPQARLEFSRTENSFRLSGDAPEADTRYALIQHESSYPDGKGYIVATGISDTEGTIQLQGSWKRWQGKFWLVPYTDVVEKPGDTNIDRLRSWNPERYLFEGREL